MHKYEIIQPVSLMKAHCRQWQSVSFYSLVEVEDLLKDKISAWLNLVKSSKGDNSAEFNDILV